MKEESALNNTRTGTSSHALRRVTEVDDELVVRVYEFVMSNEPTTLTQVVNGLRIPAADVKPAVGLLRDLGLLRHSQVFDTFRAVCPEAAQNELVLPLQQAVNDKRRELSGIHQRLHTISGIFRTLRQSHQRDEKVVTLLDPQQAAHLLADSLHSCVSEVLVMQLFDSGPGESFPPHDLPAASSGRPVRLLCPHSARARTTTRSRLRQMTETGAGVRTTNQIFENLVLVGKEVAFVAHPATDDGLPSVVAVYEPMLVSVLHRLYEFAWEGGTDFDADAVAYGDTLTDLNAGIINLMAQGLKDEVIARRFGIGSRTFRRHVSNIMDKLGVTSRFQAGVVATRAGLVDGKSATGERLKAVTAASATR